MTAKLKDVFADTVFWIALVIKQDQYHARAQSWSQQISGRITTTEAVLLETANALSRPAWRVAGIVLLKHVLARPDIDRVPLTHDLWQRGWEVYRQRQDKAWSLTDCVSFIVMQEQNLVEALTADEHFVQAGFRAVLLEEP